MGQSPHPAVRLFIWKVGSTNPPDLGSCLGTQTTWRPWYRADDCSPSDRPSHENDLRRWPIKMRIWSPPILNRSRPVAMAPLLADDRSPANHTGRFLPRTRTSTEHCLPSRCIVHRKVSLAIAMLSNFQLMPVMKRRNLDSVSTSIPLKSRTQPRSVVSDSTSSFSLPEKWTSS